MDDGTAGEMVASCRYWKAMSTSVPDGNSEDPSTPRTPNPEANNDDIAGQEQYAGAEDYGGGGGGSYRQAIGGTSPTLGEVEWASIHLDSGNVKVEASASEAQVRFMASSAAGMINSYRLHDEDLPPSLSLNCT